MYREQKTELRVFFFLCLILKNLNKRIKLITRFILKTLRKKEIQRDFVRYE